MPPRIRERLHLLTYQVAIECKLQPIYAHSTVEECIVTVLAEAPDGHQQTWTGYNWTHTGARAASRVKGRSGTITVYDAAALDPIPALLEPLALKPSNSGQGLAVRVTKKFPEVFTTWLKTVRRSGLADHSRRGRTGQAGRHGSRD